MKKPTRGEIEKFLRTEFPHIEFDGIKFQECKPTNQWFKIYSFGRMIGQADYEVNDQYWERVKNHLTWTFR
jgi:hypothetical protein